MWKNRLFGIPGIALGLLLLEEGQASAGSLLPSATVSAQTGDSNALAFTVIAVALGVVALLVGILLWMKWKNK